MNVSQEGYRNPRKGREDQEKNQEEKTASRATCRPPSRQALGTCLNGIIDDLRGRRRQETGSRGVKTEQDRRTQEGKMEGPPALSEECCPRRCSAERAS